MSRHLGLRRRIGDFRNSSLDSITSHPRISGTDTTADLSDIIEYNDEHQTVTPTNVPIPEGVLEKELHDREVKTILNDLRESPISSVTGASIEFLRKANEQLVASIQEDNWLFEHTPISSDN